MDSGNGNGGHSSHTSQTVSPASSHGPPPTAHPHASPLPPSGNSPKPHTQSQGTTWCCEASAGQQIPRVFRHTPYCRWRETLAPPSALLGCDTSLITNTVSAPHSGVPDRMFFFLLGLLLILFLLFFQFVWYDTELLVIIVYFNSSDDDNDGDSCVLRRYQIIF